MKLTYDDFIKVLNMGIELTTTRDRNRLLASMLDRGMEITHCDASTLYLYEDEMLRFGIMKTLSLGISRGENGEPIDMPPVPFTEQNVCAYAAIHREVVNIPDVYHSERFDFSGPKDYDALTGYHTRSMLVIPIENNEGELIGVLQMLNAQDENGTVVPFEEEYEIIIRSLGSLAAITLTNLQYTNEIKQQLHSFVESMATAVDARTPYNGFHTRKVAKYAVMMAEYMNKKHELGECGEEFDQERIEKISLAALLHDIGKMIVPLSIMNRATRLDQDIHALESRYELLEAYYKIDYLEGRIDQHRYGEAVGGLKEILAFVHQIDAVGFLDDENYERVQRIAQQTYTKPDGTVIPYLTPRERECLSIRKGTLTDGDRKQMENHVVMTEKILGKVHFNKNFQKIPVWAASHHEYLDGSGYPKHLTAEQLDVETRIITVADVYDALTSTDRPYKEPLSKERAMAVLRSMVEEGKMDGQLVEWLNEALEEENNEK